MILKAITEIGSDDIRELIRQQVAESSTLEYKRHLPGHSDNERREFLADVSAFANAAGGDIVFGVTEAAGEGPGATGLPGAIQPIEVGTPDAAKLRLEEIIRNGTAPRLRVQMQAVDGWRESPSGFVLVLRIPKSFQSPHMVTYKGASRFYSRHSSGKYELDVHQLRLAFAAGEALSDRIRTFRLERLARIFADETPVLLSGRGRLVIHCIHLDSFRRNGLEIPEPRSLLPSFMPTRVSSSNHRYNLEGFLIWGGAGDLRVGSTAYCQLYRNGTVEYVDASVVSGPQGELNPERGLFSLEYEIVSAAETVTKYVSGLADMGLSPPFIIGMALTGCRGARMARRGIGYGQFEEVDRDVIPLPEIVLESFDDGVEKPLKPIFDTMSNIFGLPRSDLYNPAGEWDPS